GILGRLSCGDPGVLVDSFMVTLIVALTGPGLGSLPLATVLLDQAEHRLVVELPAVDVPAATRGEIMVSLPLCRALVPVSASLHSARGELGPAPALRPAARARPASHRRRDARQRDAAGLPRRARAPRAPLHSGGTALAIVSHLPVGHRRPVPPRPPGNGQQSVRSAARADRAFVGGEPVDLRYHPRAGGSPARLWGETRAA